MIHAFPCHAESSIELKRIMLAQDNNSRCLPFEKVPVFDHEVNRVFWDGDCYLPYLKDLIDIAVAERNEVIVWTNADTCFVLDAMLDIRAIKLGYGCRYDFTEMPRQLFSSEVSQGDFYGGKDLFIFHADWWRKQRHLMPDMVIGREGWDCILSELIRLTGGIEIKNQIYHQRHANKWSLPNNRYSLPGQKHNLKLAHAWLVKHGIDPAIHEIRIDALR